MVFFFVVLGLDVFFFGDFLVFLDFFGDLFWLWFLFWFWFLFWLWFLDFVILGVVGVDGVFVIVGDFFVMVFLGVVFFGDLFWLWFLDLDLEWE